MDILMFLEISCKDRWLFRVVFLKTFSAIKVFKLYCYRIQMLVPLPLSLLSRLWRILKRTEKTVVWEVMAEVGLPNRGTLQPLHPLDLGTSERRGNECRELLYSLEEDDWTTYCNSPGLHLWVCFSLSRRQTAHCGASLTVLSSSLNDMTDINMAKITVRKKAQL